MRDFIYLAHGFRDLFPVRKVDACCKDMQKFWAKLTVSVVLSKPKAIYKWF